MQDPVVSKIASHVERVGAHGVPAAARSAAITFIADTLAVGIAGLSAPWRREILDMLSSIGGPDESTVFGSGERLPLVHAAMLNAYQIHNQEFARVPRSAESSAILRCTRARPTRRLWMSWASPGASLNLAANRFPAGAQHMVASTPCSA